MLTRAARDVRVGDEAFSGEHQALVDRYLTGKPLGPGTRSIFSALGAYLSAPGVKSLLLAARDGEGHLVAFSVGEYSSLHTAMYMFSFRAANAAPGAADLLLQGLLEHAAAYGHSRMNLGLGINGGIRGFKKKWQAKPVLP
ncbi:GNAT family N-acetyltransferase, partial [Desulfovibrio sp. OttesenSCG-928-G15]|nr:GNAT family N-acetyltransferase [Desulfovibrio sp. OttesenSCG-928-G15]